MSTHSYARLRSRLLDRPRRRLAETFKVLGDPTRVRILDALAHAGSAGLRPGRGARSHTVQPSRISSGCCADMRLVRSAAMVSTFTTPSTTSTSSSSSSRASNTCRSGAHDHHLHGLRGSRRIHIKDRGHGLPRRGRDPRAAVQGADRARGFLRRPDGTAAAREVRRGEDLDRRDRRRRRRHGHARVARSRGAGRRQRSSDARPPGAGLDVRRGAGRRDGPAVRGRGSGFDRGWALPDAWIVCAVAGGGRRRDRSQGLERRPYRLARHQRPDDHRRQRCSHSRRMVRSRHGRLPVRSRAGARSAHARPCAQHRSAR